MTEGFSPALVQATIERFTEAVAAASPMLLAMSAGNALRRQRPRATAPE